MILWKGIEVEGQYKGLLTLFIGSPDLTLQDIDMVMDDYPQAIKQFYFGAGRCTTINEDLVKQVLAKYFNKVLTMEIDITELHKYDKETLKQANLIVTTTHDNFIILNELEPEKVQLKFQGLPPLSKQFLAVSKLVDCEVTDTTTLQGKTYKGDVVYK